MADDAAAAGKLGSVLSAKWVPAVQCIRSLRALWTTSGLKCKRPTATQAASTLRNSNGAAKAKAPSVTINPEDLKVKFILNPRLNLAVRSQWGWEMRGVQL
jgi:hypothetical protein